MISSLEHREKREKLLASCNDSIDSAPFFLRELMKLQPGGVRTCSGPERRPGSPRGSARGPIKTAPREGRAGRSADAAQAGPCRPPLSRPADAEEGARPPLWPERPTERGSPRLSEEVSAGKGERLRERRRSRKALLVLPSSFDPQWHVDAFRKLLDAGLDLFMPPHPFMKPALRKISIPLTYCSLQKDVSTGPCEQQFRITESLLCEASEVWEGTLSAEIPVLLTP